MKDRTIWVVLVLLGVIAGGVYFLRSRSVRAPAGPAPAAVAPVPAIQSPPPAAPGPAPAPAVAGPTVQAGRSGVPVPLQDGKTIDMSSGRPVVRDDAASRAAIEKAKKEMAEAAAEVTFKSQPAPAQPGPAPKR